MATGNKYIPKSMQTSTKRKSTSKAKKASSEKSVSIDRANFSSGDGKKDVSVKKISNGWLISETTRTKKGKDGYDWKTTETFSPTNPIQVKAPSKFNMTGKK
jgi:hypothetical protein